MQKLGAAVKYACDRRFGSLDQGFLCQSLSVLNPHAPICVSPRDSVREVLEIFRNNRVGCVLIKDDLRKLVGIFSERDLVLKVDLAQSSNLGRAVEEFMTREPATAGFDTTIAFALNLMSHGGFRHLPIVDSEGFPVGLVSIKDVVDHLVESFLKDLLDFELPEGIA